MSKSYHKYPDWLMQNPSLIRWVYRWNNLMLEKNWFLFRKLKNIFKDLPNNSIVVDGGSGEGHHIIPLAEKFPNLKFQGVDIETENILFTEKYANQLNLKNTNFKEGNLEDFKCESLVDMIYLVGVLTLIPNDKLALKSFYDNLKTGGKLFIHTAVNEHTIIPYMNVIRNKETHYNQVHNRAHINVDKDVLEKITDIGFTIEEAIPKIGVLGILSHEVYSIFLAEIQVAEKTSKLKYFLLLILLLLTIPILTILRAIDFWIKPKKNNALIIIAKK